MPSFNIVKSTPNVETYRTSRVCGMFDIPKNSAREFRINGEIDLDWDWDVGLIVGPSGSGKSTIARDVFKDYAQAATFEGNLPLIEDFGDEYKVEEIVGALNAVGLSSAPAYLVPFSQLSTGQRFRAELAKTILEGDKKILYDEFTSVVDRNVAKATSSSLQKFVRRKGIKFVAVSCHYDIAEWLEADWVFDTGTCEFRRDRLRRPKIEVKITRGKPFDFNAFHNHHYMTSDISPTCKVYLAWVDLGEGLVNVGFFSTMPAMGMEGWARGHRTVVLPDFQGLGIGNAMIEAVAQWLWEHEGTRFRATTSAQGIVRHRVKRPYMWRLCNGVQHKRPSKTKGIKTSAGRLTTSWEYIPQ